MQNSMFEQNYIVDRPKLRPYQSAAIDSVKRSIGSGNQKVVLQAATGAGKTLTIAEVIRRAESKGNRTIFVCDSLELVEQAVKAFDSYGLDVGVMQAQHERTDESRLTQICTAQTLERRIKKFRNEFERYPVSLIIHDECFVAGTMVSTPYGRVAIQNLQKGDEVFCATGVGVVSEVMEKKTNSILKIGLSNGKQIECTTNHPFFTSNGWVEAGKLAVGERLYDQQDLRELWQSDDTKKVNEERGQVCERQREILARKKDLLNILLEEVEEPNAHREASGENGGSIKGDRTQAKNTRGQRQGANKTTKNDVLGIGRRLEDGRSGFDSNGLFHGKENATPLQNRPDSHQEKTSDRVRRNVALCFESPGTGQKKGCVSNSVRVESIQIEESTSDRVVYNLEVAGHPSYFAENVLVHNCHVQYKVRETLAMLYPEVVVIGLTATPFAKGMGEFYQDIVSAIPMQELIEQGYLSPFKAFAPFVPDMKGVKQTAGDWNKDASAEIYDGQLIADIVDTWKKHASDRQTLAFGCNVAHSKFIAAEFQKAGIKAVHVDGYGNDADKEARHQAIEDFKAGKIQLLSSVGICTKGFDAPSTSCLIIARPTKSLSLHWQIVGRGLRTADGKDDCIILDHAGNFVRHGFPTDPMDFVLHDGKAKTKSDAREKGEKLPTPCLNPTCNALKISHKCPVCGFAPEKQNEIVNVDGELVELSQIPKKVEDFTKQDKQQWYSEILGYSKIHNFSKGWVAHTYRDKFGVWPKGMKDISADTGKEVSKFIRHKFIKYQKGKAAANA